MKVADNEVLFSLKFYANAKTQLSKTLGLTNRYTKSEAYSEKSELFEVEFNYTGGTTNASAFALYQNTPNPFKDETKISFNLSQAGSVKLKIFDTTGRVVKLIEGVFTKGYHELNIKNSELNGTGILYYRLETNNNTATKKMILVD